MVCTWKFSYWLKKQYYHTGVSGITLITPCWCFDPGFIDLLFINMITVLDTQSHTVTHRSCCDHSQEPNCPSILNLPHKHSPRSEAYLTGQSALCYMISWSGVQTDQPIPSSRFENQISNKGISWYILNKCQ